MRSIPPIKSLDFIAERFWRKVDKSGGPNVCWPWLDSRTYDGYGRFRINKKKYPAHQVAYSLTHGVGVLPGFFVCHQCDNPPCCNPCHLFVGTPKDNTQDAIKKNRMGKDAAYMPTVRACFRQIRLGEGNGAAKLTAVQVVEIRTLYAGGGIPQAELASRYGVSRGLIYAILTRRNWKHI